MLMARAARHDSIAPPTPLVARQVVMKRLFDAPITEIEMHNNAEFKMPFGRGIAQFHLPAGVNGSVATSKVIPVLADPESAAAAAIATPVEGPPLRVLAQGARTVCIAVTDATRACPDHLLVPPMLAEL